MYYAQFLRDSYLSPTAHRITVKPGHIDTFIRLKGKGDSISVGQGTIKRKVRSDKKRDVKPTISEHLRETVYRISYITSTPVKDVAETICNHGITSSKVMGNLSGNFRRTVRLRNTVYIGSLDMPSIQRMKPVGKTQRISIRFKREDFENIGTLAFALDVTPSRAAALLLDASIRDGDFINYYIRDYLKTQLNEQRMNELRKVLKYINKKNPYEEEVSWGLLLTYIVDEVKEAGVTISDTVSKFIKEWK